MHTFARVLEYLLVIAVLDVLIIAFLAGIARIAFKPKPKPAWIAETASILGTTDEWLPEMTCASHPSLNERVSIQKQK